MGNSRGGGRCRSRVRPHPPVTEPRQELQGSRRCLRSSQRVAGCGGSRVSSALLPVESMCHPRRPDPPGDYDSAPAPFHSCELIDDQVIRGCQHVNVLWPTRYTYSEPSPYPTSGERLDQVPARHPKQRYSRSSHCRRVDVPPSSSARRRRGMQQLTGGHSVFGACARVLSTLVRRGTA